MDRRSFLSTALSPALVAAAPQRSIEELTLEEIGKGFATGRFTPHSLAQHYLARIHAIDKKGPALNAIIELNPDALGDAAAAERELKSAKPRSPLHGVPVLIKDNIDTAGKMSTSAGSLALADYHAREDAPVAARLRQAGAVIIGKTNLSEWANFRSTHSVSGWSGRGGQTKNPYSLIRNPSGSSSGSGAAVAANLCAVAVGTETDGSVTSPAAVNGIVGIKPTVGLVPGKGIIPISHVQDTAGPMARTVRDAALLLGVMADKDYSNCFDPAGLKGVRLGVARKFFGNNAKVDRLIEAALSRLSRMGAILVDPADLPSHGKFREPELEAMIYEFKTGLNAYLGALPPSLPVHSIEELVLFNNQHRDREMPLFEQEILIKAQGKGPLTDKAYLDAREACRRLSRDEGIDAVIRQHRVEAIIAPTSGPAWLTDSVNGDYDVGDCTGPAAIAGYPHITVPAGFVEGLPVGLSFFGGAMTEPALIRFAYAFEQETHMRERPRL